MTHLFGPVPSRRLGRSLGVDLVPPKTCTYDCIYCEVGPTTRLTLERLEWEADAILGEIDAYLEEAPLLPDFITLAGSGEPTLNAGIESLIAAVKERTQIPVAVLTNGALFFLPEVRRSLARADVVLPSLDAAREKTFRRINRPAPGLTLERLLSGLRDFRREFQGQVWLEVMLLKGLNDTEEELAALKREIARLHPDKVQLNTAVRPVVESFALALDREEMAAAAAFLGSAAEVIAHFERRPARPGALPDDAFLQMLARRPMTAKDLALALGVPLDQVRRRLKRLHTAGLVSRDLYRHQGFYRSEAGLS